MREIKLLELHLSNFKGLKDFRLQCKGNDVEIHGENGTGKTTVYDAFLWLLFDKDSEGKKDFEIKTLDRDNNPIHKLEHTVEAVLSIDGVITKFKKVYKEKWVKKQGTIEPELQGHTTEHWIDDVPHNKKNYDTYIENLIDETKFKLLTDIRYFTEKINWKERRTILTSLAENYIEDIKLPTNLSELIGNKSLEDYKKIIAEKKKKLKKELEAIPIRIDELNKSLPDIQAIDFEQIKKDIELLENDLNELNNQGKQIIEHNNKLFGLQSQLKQKESLVRDLEEQLNKEANKEYEQALKEKSIITSQIELNDRKLKILSSQYVDSNKNSSELLQKIKNLRTQWGIESRKQFEDIEIELRPELCPTCNQQLPNQSIGELKEKAKVNFEEKKKEDLQSINQSGKAFKSQYDNLQLEIEQIKSNIGILENSIQEDELKLKRINEVLSQDRKIVDFSKSKEWTILESEINDLNIQITDFKELDKNSLDGKKNTLKQEIQAHNQTLSNETQYQFAMDRQKELLEEEKALSNQLNELEKQEFQIQEYTAKRINSLESTVNGMFRTVKFKMFEDQLNGGEKEVCEILINGVPYSSANYAGRINAGLDIINTLSREYKTLATVFVDNSESVTSLMELDQQMIKLIVDKKYKQLAIVENIEIEEAM